VMLLGILSACCSLLLPASLAVTLSATPMKWVIPRRFS
jgi:hypothetical protein